MSDVDPIIGHWYHNVETDSDFEVIALDEDAQVIEVQYFDGEVEEIDWDAWYEQPIEPTDPPEGWSGVSLDVIAADLSDEEEEDTPDEEELKDEDDLLADGDEE